MQDQKCRGGNESINRAQIVTRSHHDVWYMWKITKGRGFYITLHHNLKVA